MESKIESILGTIAFNFIMSVILGSVLPIVAFLFRVEDITPYIKVGLIFWSVSFIGTTLVVIGLSILETQYDANSTKGETQGEKNVN